jgi:hypothetical protein
LHTQLSAPTSVIFQLFHRANFFICTSRLNEKIVIHKQACANRLSVQTQLNATFVTNMSQFVAFAETECIRQTKIVWEVSEREPRLPD